MTYRSKVKGVCISFGFVLLSVFGFVMVGMGIFGCGRYAPVIAPELTAPGAIKFQSFVPNAKGVLLTWSAPTADGQGKKLKKLDGFKVYRRDLPMNRLAMKQDEAEFKLVGVVADTTVAERLRREKEQRAVLKSGRQVRLSKEDLTVSFLDTNVVPGGFYLYKVIPFNSLAAEGLASSFAEVLYNGEKSVLRILYNEEDAGKLLSEVTQPEATPGAEAAGQTGAMVSDGAGVSGGAGYR
jgi:hypothetical protein